MFCNTKQVTEYYFSTFCLSTVQFSYSYCINPIYRIKNQLLVIVVVRLVEDVSLVRDPT